MPTSPLRKKVLRIYGLASMGIYTAACFGGLVVTLMSN